MDLWLTKDKQPDKYSKYQENIEHGEKERGTGDTEQLNVADRPINLMITFKMIGSYDDQTLFTSRIVLAPAAPSAV